MKQNNRHYPNLKVDGKIGAGTITATNKHPYPDKIFKGLNVIQNTHYISISECQERQEDFLNGWFENKIASIFKSDCENDVS